MGCCGQAGLREPKGFPPPAGLVTRGKSSLLRTLVCGLALTHTPAEVQVYCLDFGGSLDQLRDLPHVGAVAGRFDDELVRRTLGEMAGLLAEREQRFPRSGVDSMDTYRRRRAAG